MVRNTLKRVMLGLVFIDHETGAVFDKGPYSKEWKLITSPKMIETLTNWASGEIVAHNVTFKEGRL